MSTREQQTPAAFPVKWSCTLAGQPGKPRFTSVEAQTWFVARAKAAEKFGSTIDQVIAIRSPGA